MACTLDNKEYHKSREQNLYPEINIMKKMNLKHCKATVLILVMISIYTKGLFYQGLTQTVTTII